MKINKLLTIALLINPPAIYAGLNDTGITTCSNATQNGLPCPVAGFPGQDAEYGTNSFDFTKLDANGNAMAVTATNHSCVKDNVTGLIWEVKTDDSGLRYKDTTYTFDQAATFAANVNATNLCGHTDWRMPEIKELESIVDYSIPYPGPTIDEDYFPNTPAEWFWSASPSADSAEYAWIVNFSYGYDANGGRLDAYRARLVCAGQSLSFVFIDNANGTITDSTTGLIWAKCPLGQFGTNCEIGSASALTWAQALNAAKDSTLAGRNDWRVPNIQELRSIVDYTKYNPSINSTYFPNTPAELFWSASPYAGYAGGGAWIVNFNYGHDSYYDGRAYAFRARLVCAGQSLSFALNVAKAGNGAGSVLSTPAGINCGAVCAANFASGTSVTLTATPNTGSVFAGWGGDADCNDGTVTMDAAKNCTATFNLNITAPAVSTDAPSLITATSAILKGTVNPKGADTLVNFDFGTTTAYNQNLDATPATIAATAAATSVSAAKTGLTCGTTYHYRVTAVNSVNTTNGADKAFTTSVCPRDLIVTNITLNPAKPVAGTTFSAVVTVKNQGTSPTAASKLKLWTNLATVPVCTTVAPKIADIAAIPAGASININVSGLTSNLVGGNTFRAFADGTCLIGETNETNNQRTLSYRIDGRKPDLVITNITLTPATPTKNTVFNAAITVKNQGTFFGAGFLDVWTNQATAATCGTVGNAWADVGGLAAGASTIVNVTGLNAGATAGAKTLRAFVDSWCEEVEGNETNNQMIKSYTVQ